MSALSSSPLNGRIRQERLRLGWTQADTAARAGISSRNYARFERLGRTSVDRLVRIAAALGLSVELTASADAGISPDPLAARPRLRGVRHARPKPPAPAKPRPAADGKPTGDGTSTPRAPGVSTPPPAAPPPMRPAVDPAAVEAMSSEHRFSINRLCMQIVLGRLTNYTAATVVQNVMQSEKIPDAGKPVFVAAVEAELAQLTPENIHAYSATPDALKLWQETWRFELGIVHALG